MATTKSAQELTAESLKTQLQIESDSAIVITVAGEITQDHMTVCTELMELHLNGNNELVTLLISSDGGDAAVGWAIIDTMNFVRFPIQTTAMGFVGSAAADIFVNGDKRIMGYNSTLMVHDAAFHSEGSYKDLVATRKYHDIEYKRGLVHYQNNSKYKTEEELKKHIITGRDMFFTPEEAVEHGLADGISVSSKDKRERVSKLL